MGVTMGQLLSLFRGCGAAELPGMETDVHKITIDELLKRTGSNIETGLSTSQVEAKRKESGYNALARPPPTPEWVKFCKNMFSGFAMLPWTGAILSFVAYAKHASSLEEPTEDNLYLGMGLTAVVTAVVTGIFSYYKESK